MIGDMVGIRPTLALWGSRRISDRVFDAVHDIATRDYDYTFTDMISVELGSLVWGL